MEWFGLAPTLATNTKIEKKCLKMANTLTYHPHRNHSTSLTDLLTNIGLGLKRLKMTNTIDLYGRSFIYYSKNCTVLDPVP